MIAAFVAKKMGRYLAGGHDADTATSLTRGELSAIYKGNHYSRDESGAMRLTPPPESLDPETAMRKADEAIAEITGKYPPQEKPRSVYRDKAAIKHTIAAGVGIKGFFAKSKDNDPDAYTTDPVKIAVMWKDGQRRFKAFIRGRYVAIDIDRKPGKPDGLEAFYRLFPREILPAELQDLPRLFPCYVLTPSGGFHLYFKYEGPELKLREFALGVEIKEWQITAPGSRRENGDYTLYGELSDAPPLYGLLIDAIEEAKRRKEQAREERAKPPRARAVADRPARIEKPRITLDTLAQEAAAAHSGNHDRQVSFAGKAYRCKFTAADAVSYAKSNPAIFGSGADTENTIKSVFADNGGM